MSLKVKEIEKERKRIWRSVKVKKTQFVVFLMSYLYFVEFSNPESHDSTSMKFV